MSHNRLGNEKSPYLAQHKGNPVWWYPWGEEAFAASRAQGKPIFLSVGYATCHWCHVMEKDSFEHQDVADILNQNYISIKVDREERPDVDRLYMNSVQLLTGHGGWPMSVLMTSEGKPFWGGTFLPKERFKGLLTQVAELWKSQKDEVCADAAKVYDYLEKMTAQKAVSPSAASDFYSPQLFEQFAQDLKERFDPLNGGYRGAPKFPNALALRLAMRLQKQNGDKDLLHVITHTLRSMRRGGIFDQIGFGFHRYSVDDVWLVPHFEKMLYDNALLAQNYTEAYQLTGDKEFAQVAKEIFTYLERDLLLDCGGFASAEDADSENIEGLFYVWTDDELDKVLSPDEREFIKTTFNVVGPPNFSAHRTGEEEVLRPASSVEATAPAISGHIFYLKADQSLPDLPHSTINKLMRQRSSRVRPLRDGKVLVSWNALAISALAKGARAFNNLHFESLAVKAAQFIYDTLWNPDEAKLMRRYCDGEASVPGCADDYANLAGAFLDLYETTLDLKWLTRAYEIQTALGSHFFDIKTGAFLESDGTDKNLIMRSHELEDGVVPSSNAMAASNLWRLAQYTLSDKLKAQAKTVLMAAHSLADQHPLAASVSLATAHWMASENTQELIITGNLSDSAVLDLRRKLAHKFLPQLVLGQGLNPDNPASRLFKLLAGRPSDAKGFAFYLCQNQTCRQPTTNVDEITNQLE